MPRSKSNYSAEEWRRLNTEKHRRYCSTPHGRASVRRSERIRDRKARARQQGVPYTLEGEPPCPSTCRMCGTPFALVPHCNCATLDRKIPALGYILENVDWICLGCNSWKERRTLADAKTIAKSNPRGALLVAYLSRPAAGIRPQGPSRLLLCVSVGLGLWDIAQALAHLTGGGTQ